MNARDIIHFELGEEKWAVAIESIKSLMILKKKPLTIKLYIDKTINKKIVEANKMKLKNKPEQEFVFYYDNDMKNFIFECRRLTNMLKKSILPVSIS